MRILEIGQVPFVHGYSPGEVDFFSIEKSAPAGQRLDLRQILRLRKRLKEGAYDLVVYRVQVKLLAPWHRNGNFLRAALEVLSWTLTAFHRIAWHYFHFCLSGTAVPLVVIDTQDTPRITRTEAYWLDRCQFWFMRELPPNHLNLFLNMDRRCGDVINIRRHKLLARNLAKIRPFSIGFEMDDMAGIPRAEPHEKIHDVFYAGANHTTTVREQGLEELKALQASGVSVYAPKERLSQADFFQACSQAWIVWSPEGQGWDCYRHYEALTLYAVPLINQPTTERLWPFISGQHCLYYRPEKGGLTEVVTRALLNRDALVHIAEQGRAHILAHHTRSQLVRHVLESVGLFGQI